jgi:hypothetical protein
MILCDADLPAPGAFCGKKTINTKESLADIKGETDDSGTILNALN